MTDNNNEITSELFQNCSDIAAKATLLSHDRSQKIARDTGATNDLYDSAVNFREVTSGNIPMLSAAIGGEVFKRCLDGEKINLPELPTTTKEITIFPDEITHGLVDGNVRKTCENCK